MNMINMTKVVFFKACLLLVLVLGICQTSGMTQSKSNKANADKNGFIKIFDGKTLNGWEGDSTYWRVENGSLVGEIKPDKLLKTNSFIVWQGGQPADFELKGEFRITKDGNSGVNYRSEQLKDVPHALRGYQADIDGKNTYTGQNYEERGRTTLAYQGQKVILIGQDNTNASVQDYVKNNAWMGAKVTESLGSLDSLKALIKSEDWNEFHLVVKGNRLQHYFNGVLMSDVTDNDAANRKMSGLLGVQVHIGPPMKVEYRNMRLKQKPEHKTH